MSATNARREPRRPTLSQQRLDHALTITGKIRGENETDRQKYRKAAEEAPMLLRTLGLGQGIAVLASKEEKGPLALADAVAIWLLRECPHSPFRQAGALPAGEQKKEQLERVRMLLKKIVEAEPLAYRQAQTEAVAYAGWLKQMAQAFVPKPEEEG